MIGPTKLAKKKEKPDLKDKSLLSDSNEQKSTHDLSLDFVFDNNFDDFSDESGIFFQDFDENITPNDDIFRTIQQTDTEKLQLTTNNSCISAQKDTNSITLNSVLFKKKVELSYLAEKFKNYFYQLFTTRKRFSKKIVIKIHEVIRDQLHLPKMKREAMRNINLYFTEYAPISNLILTYIHKHKKQIIEKVAELRSLKI